MQAGTIVCTRMSTALDVTWSCCSICAGCRDSKLVYTWQATNALARASNHENGRSRPLPEVPKFQKIW